MVIVYLQQFAHPCLGNDRIQPGEVGRKLGEELGLVRDDARLRRQARLLADQHALQVDLELVSVEHPHVAGESLDAHGRASLANHRVQQIARFVDVTLGIGGQL